MCDSNDWMTALLFFNQGINREYPHTAEAIAEALQFVENCSETIYLVVAKITPVLGLMPKAFISLYLYYFKGMGRDAFQMTDETIS